MIKKISKITCIGAGYVGGPTMAVVANNCPNIDITVVDLNTKRIDDWNSNDLNKLPIYEPGLDEIIKKCRGKNLFFSTDVEINIREADLIFLCVNTPVKSQGIGAGEASDLKWIESSARQVALHATGETIVVEKSTIPVKTAETIKTILDSSVTNSDVQAEFKKFHVLSIPEFLAEGTAIKDLQSPDRVLIGGEDSKASEALASIYKNWIPDNKIIRTNLWSSELSKLTANAFLAQRISSINSISALCEMTGANIKEVKKAIGMDSRIGDKFLNAGPGFGGSCFKKDILNLVYLCKHYNLDEVASYWRKVLEINEWQQKRISKIILEKLFGTLTNKKISILGFSFKSDTNDTRESPAINICRDLLSEGANLYIYDPKVNSKQIEFELNSKENIDSTETGSWVHSLSVNESIKDSHCVVIITEWEEFTLIDWENVSKEMLKPAWIFDTRGIISLDDVKSNNLQIWSIGNGHNCFK